MTEYKKIGGDKFIKFVAGSSVEGVFKEFKEIPNPFPAEKDKEPKKMYSYTIETQEGEKILTSTSEYLPQTLGSLPYGTKVKLDMFQKGAKKIYGISVAEE